VIVNVETLIGADHPIRAIKRMCDAPLAAQKTTGGACLYSVKHKSGSGCIKNRRFSAAC